MSREAFMANVRVERRLAAIMAVDVVGYSRLVETDEARTLADIRRVRSQISDRLIAERRGRLVKLMGDGAIVEFGSVVDAVACAVALQEEMTRDQAEVPPEHRIVYRIGISLGDVVVEGDDLLGDGINIAARLEALADPGGICISDTVRKQLAGKSSVAFEDIGERRLKNMAQPIRVFRWAEATVAVVPGMSLPLPEKPSIAVLPFDNLSGQPEDTYFSDGITEDIITGLAHFRSLFVIARNSSFAFRGKPTDLAEIGRRLGVSYLLEGSVRRAGERVRINAQLVEAASGAHVWAERYDRNLDDVFVVQDEVAQMIVSALVGRIEDADLKRLARTPTDSLTAYDCLLRGLAHFRGYAEDDNQRACEMFERAVVLDPQYAVAHAYLAFVRIAMCGYASAPAEVLAAARSLGTRAVGLDPQESRCHRMLGGICLFGRDYDAAEHHLRRSIDLNPSDADGLMQMGYLLALRGRAHALGWMEAAIRLNPFHPLWYNADLGVALYTLRRYAEAAQAFKRLPDRWQWSSARLAACYAHLGQSKEAQTQAAVVMRFRPDFSTAEFLRNSILLEHDEDREHLREGLIKAGLPE
jgi:TolB-like protein/class 3 adenylate cyclase/Tfp pilus assembly protein PilF